ncbi:uncharacterized protein B0H18DRAFT_1129119 [Fomitopsis serialis]|uniref:uncharacterized protein n=1 Tax=Fomitopsis serialis TaxID=139415 RepID=UPI002008444B|nr:uncharacterized protein B0H18DRAFT_1129119 [Neoantrodia serialis]KAH9911082.1 hypothetical protein B0H18DRAFT_1129119 [Neoantrodia serialis]
MASEIEGEGGKKRTSPTKGTEKGRQGSKRKNNPSSEDDASDNGKSSKQVKKRAKVQHPAKETAGSSSNKPADDEESVKSVVVMSPRHQKRAGSAPREETELTARLGAGAKGARPTRRVAHSSEDDDGVDMEGVDKEGAERSDQSDGGSTVPQRRKQRTAKERDTKGTRKTKATALHKETLVVEEESDEDDSFVPEGSHSEPEDSDGEELEAEDNDDIIVKSEPEEKKVKAKGKAKGKANKTKGKGKAKAAGKAGANKDAPGDDDDPLAEPMIKALLQRAVQEFRLHLALENAWPRNKGGRIKKDEVPADIIMAIKKKYKVFRMPDFKEMFDARWDNQDVQDDMTGYVYRIASQFCQEVKQKAKRAVERAFLNFKVSDLGPNGERLNSVGRAEKLHRATEARVKFLREKNIFHYGDVDMRDPDTDPGEWTYAEHMPFHNNIIGDVIARQWWLGHNPEALRARNRDRFDLSKPLPSNLIALACSAVMVALDEIARGVTINFDAKSYAPEHDKVQAQIDKYQKMASPNLADKYEGAAAFVKSMNDTLAMSIRASAGLGDSIGDGGVQGAEDGDEDMDVNVVLGPWKQRQQAAAAGPSNNA